MKRIILIASLGVTLQACARVADTAPSFLGMPSAVELSDDDDAVAPSVANGQSPELRHIASNKVLGAMAFQKITGRAVDPTRLQGNR